MQDNVSLFRCGDLGIGYERRRKQRVGFVADVAVNPADTQRYHTVWCFKMAGVITVDGKTGSMAAGTL